MPGGTAIEKEGGALEFICNRVRHVTVVGVSLWHKSRRLA
jgi:hypothetical protein